MNPFQSYAYGYTSPYNFPPEAPRTLEPMPVYSPRNAGYMGIYGTQPTREETPVPPGVASVMRGMQEGSAGEGGRDNPAGASPTSPTGYNPPAIQGYDTAGKIAGAIGLATGLPLGAPVTALSALSAQDALRSYGIKDELSMKDALLAGATFGLFGKSIDQQMMSALNQPHNLTMYDESLLGMQGIPGLAAAFDLAAKATSGAMPADVEALGTGVLGVDTNVQPGQGGPGTPGSDPTPDTSNPDPGPGDRLARGGYVPGGSGGMDDDVPAIIDGKGPARLSSGEFVFDAATVAALGDGNNTAGAKKLDGLRKAIRKKAYGHEKQPPQNYSVGDLVRLYDKGR
jgi:hypothetical protein